MKKNLSNNPTLLALIVGFLCLPCLLIPLLISVGFGSLLSFIFPWLAPLFITLAVVGLIVYVHIQRKVR